MKEKIFFGIALASASLGIKLCRDVSKEYAKKHADNPTMATKIATAVTEIINSVAGALDLAIRATFVVFCTV